MQLLKEHMENGGGKSVLEEGTAYAKARRHKCWGPTDPQEYRNEGKEGVGTCSGQWSSCPPSTLEGIRRARGQAPGTRQIHR